ncbi:hypothetical protein [Beijerinckia mobilis]|nr:hypothetical protein [Beijerinckia mobilis]
MLGLLMVKKILGRIAGMKGLSGASRVSEGVLSQKLGNGLEKPA